MFQKKSSYLSLWQRLIFVFGGALLSLLLAMTSGFAADAGLKVLPGHRPNIPGSLVADGSLPATRLLRLAIGVSPRDEKGLDDFLTQLYDPAGTQFHHFLSPDEFTAQFGLTVADYEKVMEFAVTNGLTVAAFDLTWNTGAGLIYQVQYTTNLFPAHWINLGKPLISTNESLSISDTNGVNAVSRRFYRLLITP
jgi:hypothetical protein